MGKLNPKYETRKKIAQGLGVPLVELLPEKDYSKTWLAYSMDWVCGLEREGKR